MAKQNIPKSGTESALSARPAGALALSDVETTLGGALEPTARSGVSVGVLVDLEWSPEAGGHVKCWERFAEAARSLSGELDLTIYFLGDTEYELSLADNVRYVILPPSFGTARIPFLKNGGGNTDLARFHPGLAARLERAGHAVIHATDVFSFARTALSLCRRFGWPLVSSTHTDLPTFTGVYTREIVERQLGDGMLSRLVLDRFGVQKLAERNMQRRVLEILKASRHVLVSSPADLERLAPALGPDRVGRLRRGIDKRQFSPRLRDRERLLREYGIGEDQTVLLFVGRLDDSKKVMTMARAARILLDRGLPIHVMAIGRGADADNIRRLLGPKATMPGNLPQPDVAWLYASSDLFVFPSESEIAPNVVLEAKASGLPVLLSAHDGGAQFVREPGKDGILVTDRSDEAWAQALVPLVRNAIARAEIAFEARKHIDTDWPDWEAVLLEDLLPVWKRVGAARAAQPRRILKRA